MTTHPVTFRPAGNRARPSPAAAATRTAGQACWLLRHGSSGDQRAAGPTWFGDAGEATEEVALPGDAGLTGQHADEHSAVEEEQHGPEQHLPDGVGEDSAQEQVDEPAEREDGGADVDRVVRGGEPDPDAADQPHDGGDRDPSGDSSEQDQEAEDEQRDRVGRQVRPSRFMGATTRSGLCWIAPNAVPFTQA